MAKPRPLSFTVHSWAGLKLSILLAFVLATGTLATLSNEMDWLARPALRVVPQDAPAASWGTLLDNARAAAPGATAETLYAPQDPWFAASVRMRAADDSRFWVYLDPWSGEVRGTGAWASFQRFFRQTHRHLMLPTKYGVPIVSSLALLLLASLVTGLITYKKFWRGFLRAPRTGDTRRLTGDLHRLAGVWSLWFVVLMIATGLWYLVESLGGDAPRLPEPPQVTAVETIDGAALDRAVAAARAAYPGLDLREVRLPLKPGEAVEVLGQADAVLVRDRANAVAVDPASAMVVLVSRGENLGVHQRISEMADPLHFGTWGGLATKLVWFVFGLLLTGLAVTGAMIYSLRLARGPDAPERASLRLWRGMGAWRYAATAGVVVALALAPFSMSGAG
jgi:uncharacterized iron-regulated membrane protein